jgi:cysteinyl-tRNA synthetase
MDDDFNTSGAMSSLHELARAINSFTGSSGRGDGERTAVAFGAACLWKMGAILGFMDSGTLRGEKNALKGGDETTEGLMRLIISIRAAARAKKDWGTSDAIRDGLKELGITLEDTADGARWKIERR